MHKINAKHIKERAENGKVFGEKLSFAKESDNSMGRVRSFYGNMGVTLKAFIYILEYGKAHLGETAQNAVLNANYIKACLRVTTITSNTNLTRSTKSFSMIPKCRTTSRRWILRKPSSTAATIRRQSTSRSSFTAHS